VASVLGRRVRQSSLGPVEMKGESRWEAQVNHVGFASEIAEEGPYRDIRARCDVLHRRLVVGPSSLAPILLEQFAGLVIDPSMLRGAAPLGRPAGLSAKFGQKHAGQFMRGAGLCGHEGVDLELETRNRLSDRDKNANLQRKGAATGESHSEPPAHAGSIRHFAACRSLWHYTQGWCAAGEFLRCRGGNGPRRADRQQGRSGRLRPHS